MQPTLDLAFVRKQFPAFSQKSTGRWAFFENAGGSYVPEQVIDRLNRFFVEYKVQPYGASSMSRAAGEAMDEGYRVVADLLNADQESITLGPSTTMNLYVLAQALRPTLEVGDEIIVTNQDHEANIGCWRRLSEFGVLIREWRIDPDSGELDLETLAGLLNEKTRLVCVSLCSNIVATVNPITQIAAMAHAVGALVVADGVSHAPHAIMDVETLGVDFLVYSTYKTFATHLGVLWGHPQALAKLEPQGHFFNADSPHYRLNPAGPLHAEIGALVGLGPYLDTLYEHHFAAGDAGAHERAKRVFELFAQHEANLAQPLLDLLHDHPNARLIGKPRIEAGRRAPTISFVPLNMKPAEVATALARGKIAVGSGHFYAWRCLQGLHLEPANGVVRISLVHYNTEAEVERLIRALNDILDSPAAATGSD